MKMNAQIGSLIDEQERQALGCRPRSSVDMRDEPQSKRSRIMGRDNVVDSMHATDTPFRYSEVMWQDSLHSMHLARMQSQRASAWFTPNRRIANSNESLEQRQNNESMSSGTASLFCDPDSYDPGCEQFSSFYDPYDARIILAVPNRNTTMRADPESHVGFPANAHPNSSPQYRFAMPSPYDVSHSNGSFPPNSRVIGLGPPPLQDFMQQKPRLPTSLSVPSDEMVLSPHQAFLRQQIELFEAGHDDIRTHTRGRNKAIILGQVGIRCRYCAHLPVIACSKGAIYFPANLAALYQAAQNMSTNHMQCGLCREMPDSIKDTFKDLIPTKKSSSSAGRVYWATTAQDLGLLDTEDGVFLY